MSSSLYTQLQQKFPFISILSYGANNDEYIGIVQNAGNTVTCFYDFGSLKSDEEKKLFLTLGEKWYFESNRMLPINIFLKDEWEPFNKYFKTFVTKELTVIHGPATSLDALSTKKKRRSITMIKKLN